MAGPTTASHAPAVDEREHGVGGQRLRGGEALDPAVGVHVALCIVRAWAQAFHATRVGGQRGGLLVVDGLQRREPKGAHRQQGRMKHHIMRGLQ
eukprot:1157993-Pelagomonas_calceolata.AAC.5